MLPGEIITPASLLLVAVFLSGFSGVPLLFSSLPAAAGQTLATLSMTIASLTGICGALLALLGHVSPIRQMPWGLPFDGAFLAVDPLSAVFLFIIFSSPGPAPFTPEATGLRNITPVPCAGSPFSSAF